MEQVLILGGTGRIGRAVAADLVQHTQAQVTVSGRNSRVGTQVATRLGENVQFLALDLADRAGLSAAISSASLVIHCAGPFHHRDARALKTCIQQGVNYLDVSDHRSFTLKALACRADAEAAGITAIVNSGVFPGISNSMVRQDVESLDSAEQIHLSYVVAGSGGAGPTVMRTTFLGLQHPFEVQLDGQWQVVQPYSDRETIEFPAPYGKAHVYWFDMPEALTLVEAFPVKTVITKFGSVPDFYNHVTWFLAHQFPRRWLQRRSVLEFLAWGSHHTTSMTDRFSGIGVAMRSEVKGEKDGKPALACSTLAHENTAIAAGYGTGSIAQLVLSGQLRKPGIWPVEQALTTDLFQQTMKARGVKIHQECQYTAKVT